ncbi:MAG TPA: sulfurtransferase TusA family protein [Candidatus Dormibacteraeota bacterium]|nr:sulfurtransferase TusA family protein [Candidatus Dormibacteraeota bacterium]
MAEVTEDRVLDCRGQLCPMPVVRVGKAMGELAPGQVLKVMATDRGAVVDLPAWARDTGNELLSWHEEPRGEFVFYVRKGEDGVS